MESFERAHVAKTKDCSQKETKSGENKKEQLRQMLYGYKHSDNKLIKESEDLKIDFENSSSVSGVSDLNLTSSSVEGDEPPNLTNSDLKDTSPFNSKDLSSLDVNSSEVELKDKKERESCQKLNPKNEPEGSAEGRNRQVSAESLSDYNEEIESPPEDADLPKYPHSAYDTMFDFTSEDSDPRSDDDEFDPDGSLAQKILARLEESRYYRKQGEKRKRDPMKALKAVIQI
ncbi:uncharacterized protein LOC113230922 [Hyposmocoma kahamanoa]|uniref:uncharacterized protein LOC113230922 n=1 Tax=Hyposmocoma kahamanoa TaxID=1477025 RepID=UPI000E6D5FC7|nr:uncharacterized protein LOC113230922 [Hyposmocoma kahamanoa]